MAERLRRAGIRSIDAVVDVTNYVMLELGQPLHAFDLDALEGGIRVRKAQPDERITLCRKVVNRNVERQLLLRLEPVPRVSDRVTSRTCSGGTFG